MGTNPAVVIQGADAVADVPGIEALAGEAELRFAPDTGRLRDALPGAPVLLGWDFRGSLADAWGAADRLRWVHWCGAGVDAVLFPDLAASDVVLTNARGIFDRPMAEYALALMLAMAKRLPETVRLQQVREWRFRFSERLDGTRALVIGPGSIGREIARVLRGVGVEVEAVGRTPRPRDPDFGEVHPRSALHDLLPGADWVILIVPLTPDTEGMIGAAELAAMKPGARLVNLGRGRLIDEPALVRALRDGAIAGAALDVFHDEPLPASSPLWGMENVIVSPHMSGDWHGSHAALADLFVRNFRRFVAGEPLLNVVDKRQGFAALERAG